MDQKTFMAKMQELLEREDELELDMSLEEIEEWDSLSFVAFLAMADKVSGNRATPDAIRAAKTIGDLYVLVKAD